MAREFAKAFYKSKEWLKVRAAYIAKRKSIDGGLCESCHEKPGYIVHHKIELTPENSHEYFQVIEKDGTYHFVLRPGFTAYGDGYTVVLDNGSEATVSAGGSRYLFVMAGEGDPYTWIESWTASGTIIKHSIPDDLWFKAGDKYIIMIKK